MSEILEFTKSMPAQERSDAFALYPYGLWPQPTGSRFICPDAVREDSDWDLFCMATEQQIELLIKDGWESGRTVSSGPPDGDSLRKGALNLVLFLPAFEHLYRAFETATNVCRLHRGPKDKPTRVDLFKAFTKNAQPAVLN